MKKIEQPDGSHYFLMTPENKAAVDALFIRIEENNDNPNWGKEELKCMLEKIKFFINTES